MCTGREAHTSYAVATRKHSSGVALMKMDFSTLPPLEAVSAAFATITR